MEATPRCRACGYDVSTSLRDEVPRCPECGGGISATESWLLFDQGAGLRRAMWYLALSFAAPMATVVFAMLLGPLGLGERSQLSSVLGILIAYTGGTLCLLGWPTGAGFVVERLVLPGRVLKAMTVFAGLIVLSGCALVGGLLVGLLVMGVI